ncbi:hypothetical protein GCM10027589_33690 [Actinocorallia lasiicapitis]
MQFTGKSARAHWPVIVIGGGPAATLQIKRLMASGFAAEDLLVVSDGWGAPGMAFLGRSRLQSYTHELELEDGTARTLTEPGFLQPTGSEYHRYAERVLRRSGAVRCRGTVTDLRTDPAGFAVRVRSAGRDLEFRSPCVILATGTRPKRPPEWLRRAGIRTYDQVYRDVQEHTTDYLRGRSVLVIGSGNSAMQTASLLAGEAADVTVYAAKYLGMYPVETTDRFAWRAPSQLTWELVVKSSHREQVCDGSRPCVRFLVYRSIDVLGDSFAVTVRAADNDHQMGLHSRPGLHSHLRVAEVDGGWREEVPLESAVVVWATGCEPVYPPSALIDALAKDVGGYLLADEHGETGQPGLFVTGACAGRRAVNEMLPARTAAAP